MFYIIYVHGYTVITVSYIITSVFTCEQWVKLNFLIREQIFSLNMPYCQQLKPDRPLLIINGGQCQAFPAGTKFDFPSHVAPVMCLVSQFILSHGELRSHFHSLSTVTYFSPFNFLIFPILSFSNLAFQIFFYFLCHLINLVIRDVQDIRLLSGYPACFLLSSIRPNLKYPAG